MDPFARAINVVKKYVVSSTLDRVDWNAELVRGDLGDAVQRLKQQSGKRLEVWGVKFPLAGHGPTLFAGAIEGGRSAAREPAGIQLGGGGDAV